MSAPKEHLAQPWRQVADGAVEAELQLQRRQRHAAPLPLLLGAAHGRRRRIAGRRRVSGALASGGVGGAYKEREARNEARYEGVIEERAS